ncbi:MAG: HAMP domain-containing sensor histidine kinase [Bacteroidales bacterium]|nr:HAMP domain-containing sensor histidine kinase [Bacteroidales bacterium]
MRKNTVTTGLVAMTTAIILFVLIQSSWLINTYESEKGKFQSYVNEAIHLSLEPACFELFLDIHHYQNTFAMNVLQKKIHVVKDNRKSEFEMSDETTVNEIYTRGSYDMQVEDVFRDSLLYSLFDKRMKRLGLHTSILFQRVDLNTGKTLASSLDWYPEKKRPLCADTIPLGYVSNHVLTARYNYPFELFYSKISGVLIADAFMLLMAFVCFFLAIRTIVIQKRSSEEREFLMRTIVHELKSPLNYLSSLFGSIESRSGDSDNGFLQNLFPKASKKLDGLRKNIEKILVATSRSAMVGKQRKFFNLKESLSDLVSDFQCDLPSAKSISLNYESEIHEISGDPTDLPGAVSALIENAFKYSGKDATVSVRVYDVKNRIFIAVKDNGCGISKKEQRRIFDKYFRSKRHLSDSGVKGFGLGLSYVQMVAEAHNGKISVISKIDKGSEFILEIPIIKN